LKITGKAKYAKPKPILLSEVLSKDKFPRSLSECIYLQMIRTMEAWRLYLLARRVLPSQAKKAATYSQKNWMRWLNYGESIKTKNKKYIQNIGVDCLR